METVKCKICGMVEDITYLSEEKKEKAKKEQVCYSCKYWKELLEEDTKRSPHTVAIIDGAHYVIEPENDSSEFRGFGGDKFEIRFHDGAVITTTNLWYQSKIPAAWKEKFPDNATFDWEWKETGCGNQFLVPKKK